MPWNDKLLGSRFEEKGRDLDTEAQVQLKVRLGQYFNGHARTSFVKEVGKILHFLNILRP